MQWRKNGFQMEKTKFKGKKNSDLWSMFLDIYYTQK